MDVAGWECMKFDIFGTKQLSLIKNLYTKSKPLNTKSKPLNMSTLRTRDSGIGRKFTTTNHEWSLKKNFYTQSQCEHKEI